MELINTSDFFSDWVNGISFLMGLVITVAFYAEYKKCAVEIEKQEMLDQFLNDSEAHI